MVDGWVVSNLLINSSKSLEVRVTETDNNNKKNWSVYVGECSPSVIFPPQLLVRGELSVSRNLLSGVYIVWLLGFSFPEVKYFVTIINLKSRENQIN